jgi:hypothetical protein
MNRFQDPETVNSEKNREVKNLIREMFNRDGKLEFHDMLQYLEKSVEERDFEKAKICAYYCFNVISSESSLSDTQKLQLINGIEDEIEKLENDSNLT